MYNDLKIIIFRSVFVHFEWAVYIYMGSGSPSTEAAMLHRHVSTEAQNEQTAVEK